MKKALLLLVAVSLAVGAVVASADEAKPYYRQPAISPDGGTIAFVHADDIYTVDANGGVAKLIVSNPAADTNPRFSPDGTCLAFTSYRTGGGDVYLINLTTGELKRLTWHDGTDQVEGWSPDSKWVYFSSSRHEIRGSDIYRVSIDSGMPVPVAREAYEQEYNVAVSPDGNTIAFNTNDRVRQWWRKGPVSNDATQIWLKSTDPAATDYRKFTEYSGKDSWPMWAPDGNGLYFVSNEGQTNAEENIFYKSISGDRRKITGFTSGRVLWPDIAHNSGDIVFEREFGIWLLPAGGQAHAVEITTITDEKSNPIENRTFSSQVTEYQLSPDNKKVAFIIHGEVFVAPAEKGDEDPVPTAYRVTHTAASEQGLAWDKDSNRLIYSSYRFGNPDLFIFDFITRTEKRLTDTPEVEGVPLLSPDGKWAAYYRGMNEIRLINMEDLSDKLFASGFFFSEVVFNFSSMAWSPDSKWLAYVDQDDNFFKNIYAKRIEGDTNPVQITDLPNINNSGPFWSADGRFMVFTTAQDRQDNEIWRVDLVPLDQEFQEDKFDELFVQPGLKDEKGNKQDDNKQDEKGKDSAAKKEEKKVTVEIQPEGIRDRLSQLASFADNSFAVGLTPDDKQVLFINNSVGRTSLWSVNADPTEFSNAKQLRQAPNGGIGNIQFAKDKKTFWFIEGSSIKNMPINGGNAKPYALSAEMEVDFHKENVQAFREAWVILRDNFYDGTFNGQDWNQVYDHFLPYIKGARSDLELSTIMNLMLGDLNASHSGVYGGDTGGTNTPVGDLGITFDPKEYVASGRFKIEDIVPDGAVAREKGDIKVGDYLLSIDGFDLTGKSNINQLLERTLGKRVKLGYAANPDGERKELSVKPISNGRTSNLRYLRWVEENRKYVDKISDGRLGYLHIAAMGYGDLQKFKLDLSAQTRQREGVVIDIRYNNGGYVAPFVLDVLHRRTTLYNYFRDKSFGTSANTAGNRVYDKPTILVQNERSLSNAEMFAEGYRQLGLGKIVGSASNGWVIWTWGTGLINDMLLRLPRMKVTTLEGQDLDDAPRMPDVFIERPIGEGLTGKDSQLDVAVQELLHQIDG